MKTRIFWGMRIMGRLILQDAVGIGTASPFKMEEVAGVHRVIIENLTTF